MYVDTFLGYLNKFPERAGKTPKNWQFYKLILFLL